MRFIKRIPISEAMIAGTQAQQTNLWYTNEAGALVSVSPWVSGQNVTVGDRRSHEGKVWQALSTHAQTAEPDVAPTYWAFVAPTNLWAAFDDAVGSYTQESGSLSFTLTPTLLGEQEYKFDAFGCLGMAGDTLSVDVSIPGSTSLQPYGTRTLPAGVWTDVTYGNAFLAVGSTGGAYSTNGASWAARTMPSGNWQSVSYGNGFWLAAKDYEATVRALPATAYWKSVAYGNGVFVAVADSLSTSVAAATSPDGVTWTQRALPYSVRWNSVAYGNGVFVVIAHDSNLAATSPDGITWTLRNLPATNWWYSIAYGNGVFVAVAYGPPDAIATSPDGITWTSRTSPSAKPWFNVTYGNGLFVAVALGYNVAATSPDGITWTLRTLPSNQQWYSVTYGNGLFVAIASSNQAAATSPDGVTWTARTLPSGSDWLSVTYGNGLFVAVAYGTKAATSPDGVTWAERTLPGSAVQRFGVTYGNGVFVLVPYGGSEATTLQQPQTSKSTNTTTWSTPTPLSGDLSLLRLAASATHHVAVAPNQISYTTDGVTFTPVALAGNWRDVAYVGNRFIALSQGNLLAYSTNATTWTPVLLGSSQTWTGAAFGNGQYILVSDSGVIARSSNGTSFTIDSTTDIDARSITFGNGLFVINGYGKALTSLDGFSWVEVAGGLAGDTWVSSAYANISGTDTFVALSSSKAASATLGSSIYQTTVNLVEDQDPIIDFWTYAFSGFRQKEDLIVTGLNSASYTNASITITISGSVVKLGTFNFGQVQKLGATELGMQTGITNYSTYDVDAFGVTRIVPRSFSKKLTANVRVDRAEYNSVYQALVDYKDTAVIVFPTDCEEYSKATAYGHIREWSLSIDYPTYTMLPIEVRGLT